MRKRIVSLQLGPLKESRFLSSMRGLSLRLPGRLGMRPEEGQQQRDLFLRADLDHRGLVHGSHGSSPVHRVGRTGIFKSSRELVSSMFQDCFVGNCPSRQFAATFWPATPGLRPPLNVLKGTGTMRYLHTMLRVRDL